MLIVIYGDDNFLSRRYLNEVKDFYLKNHPFYYSYDFDSTENEEQEDLNNLKGIFNERNLFSSTKVILLENIFSHAPKNFQNAIIKLLKDNHIDEAKDILVILFENSSHANVSIFKKKAKIFKEFSLKDDKSLSDFIKKEAKSFNIQLDNEALKILEMNFKNDKAMIYFALKKLSQLDKSIINKNDVLNNVYLETSSNIFNLLDALVNKKPALAFKYLNKEKQSENFGLILWHMIREIRILIILNQANPKNLPLISKKFSIHPYIAKKLFSLSKKYDFQKLLTIYERLTNYDLKVKTGKMDIDTALDLIILDFNNI